jgi:tetratricopeptide (TPR) repeat protein
MCQELLGTAMATITAGASKPSPPSLPRPAIDRYTILSQIGRGGMGEVYAAFDSDLDRKVALKLLRADGDVAQGRARLLREAKAMAKVAHPNVVAVHDVGTFGDHVFVAMDFVDGSTLRDWLAERPRTTREILAVFVQAARGLMAAHAAGLVHRDFKPSNVMLARDGAVRVMDFGLARAQGDAEPEGAPGALPDHLANLQVTLTATGQLIGTPRYMAPEQFKAGPTDARTDQFGFCVALYEALYGAPPFGEGALQTLAAAVLAGHVQPVPPKGNVPAWLRRVLLRGLSVAPADRWPSMRELVAALARDPSRGRRRWTQAASAGLLAAIPLVFVARERGQSAALCQGGTARLAGAWERLGPRGEVPPRRAAIERAFLSSGATAAKDVWTRVAGLLDRYAAGWLAMYKDTCAATHVHRVQPASVLDLRMACLDDRRTALAALTDVFAHADREGVGKGVDAVNALPDLARCADVEALRTPVEPPRDEATRLRVADFRRRLANAKALNDTGKHVEALAIARAVISDARALGYRPALTQALGDLAGSFLGIVETPDVVPLIDDALWSTLGAGRDDLAASAAVGRLSASYFFATDLDECRFWVKLSRALLERVGALRQRLGSWLLHAEAGLELRANNSTRALALVREATAIKERVLPAGHPDVAIGWNFEADILHSLGRSEEALPINKRAYDVFVAAYGPASVEASYTLNNRGECLMDVKRPAEALVAFEEALSHLEAHVGSEHPNLSHPLTGVGHALVALGRPREAVSPLERALRLRDPAHTDQSLVAETELALAKALTDASMDDARARALATKARDAYLRGSSKAGVAAVDAWLAAHPQAKKAR